jgi:hypothetical protein
MDIKANNYKIKIKNLSKISNYCYHLKYRDEYKQ